MHDVILIVYLCLYGAASCGPDAYAVKYTVKYDRPETVSASEFCRDTISNISKSKLLIREGYSVVFDCREVG